MLITSNKIWFSNQPDIFLPIESQQKLIALAANNIKNPDNTFKIRLIYWKKLLNERAINALEAFCNLYAISSLDLDDLIPELEENPNFQLEMLTVAKIELEEWVNENGGNAAVAADIVRCLPIIIASQQKHRNCYSDFDIDLHEDMALIEMIESDKHACILDGDDKDQLINNDILYFAPGNPLLDVINTTLYKQIHDFAYKPENSTEAEMRQFFSLYPFEQAYFPISIDDLLSASPCSSDIAVCARNNIHKRQLLTSHISPSELHGAITGQQNPFIYPESIHIVTRYCGPEILVSILKNKELKKGVTLIQTTTPKSQSWHPISSYFHKKNRFFPIIYLVFPDYQNFLLRIDILYNRIGSALFSIDDLNDIRSSSIPKHEIGQALYRFKSLLTTEAVKFLYEKAEVLSNAPLQINLIAFYDRVLQKKFNGVTFAQIFSRAVIYAHGNLTPVLTWLNDVNNIPTPPINAYASSDFVFFPKRDYPTYSQVEKGIYRVDVTPIYHQLGPTERVLIQPLLQGDAGEKSTSYIKGTIKIKKECICRLDFTNEDAASNLIKKIKTNVIEIEKSLLMEAQSDSKLELRTF